MSTLRIIPSPKLDVYEDSKGEWRWNIKVNSEIIGASTEGYINRKDCLDNILTVEKRIKYFREKDLIK